MSWPMVKLGDLVSIKGGGTPSKSDSSFWGGDIPWASVKDLKDSRISVTEDTINNLGVKNSATNIIPAGTIITATRMALGRFAINTVDMAINQDLKALFVKDQTEISRDYLFRFLESKAQYIEGEGKGATVKGITLDFLKSIDVPLPPLAEQKRIAAILDKADAIRRKRQQAIQLADDFLRAVFLEMFGDPVTNPKGWEVKLLKDIAKIQIGPFGTQLHKEDYVSDGIPLVNPSHIKNSEVVPDCNLTVNKTKFEELTEYHLAVGDIIMGRRGEMGRCALIGERESGWLCGTGSLYIRPFVNNAQSFYLFKYLTSDYIKTYLEGESLGATMPNLNKTIVGNIKVPMPSTKAITKFQKILAADKAYREKITLIDNSLFESLSQKAFSGQL